MKKILFSSLVLIFSQSCNNSNEPKAESQFKQSILDYFQNLKTNATDDQILNLNELISSIDFVNTVSFQLGYGERVIIANIRNNAKLQAYDALRFYFYLYQNQIVRSGIIGFNDKTKITHNELAVRHLSYDRDKMFYSGRISMLSPFGDLRSYNEYSNGRLLLNGTVRPKEALKQSGRVAECYDYYLVITNTYSDGSTSTSYTFLYSECERCQEYARQGRVSCGGGGGGSAANGNSSPSFPINPTNNQVIEFVDNEGTYKKYKFNLQKNQWDLVEVRLLEVTVRAKPESFPFLNISWPVNGQIVFGNDNLVYSYDLEFNAWFGALNVEVAPPTRDIIADLVAYLKCFNNGAQAQITIYVDEPKPGSGEAYDKSNVGHVFITITQQVNGQTIERTIGFYPSGWVTPINPSNTGALVNDAGHSYDVHLTLNITSEQLSNILNSIQTSGTSNYHLNYFNCTNFAIGVCGSIGITLPQTIGTWPGGQGLNPGSLGNDIMNMPLPSNYVSRSNGGGIAPTNKGDCN